MVRGMPYAANSKNEIPSISTEKEGKLKPFLGA